MNYEKQKTYWSYTRAAYARDDERAERAFVSDTVTLERRSRTAARAAADARATHPTRRRRAPRPGGRQRLRRRRPPRRARRAHRAAHARAPRRLESP